MTSNQQLIEQGDTLAPTEEPEINPVLALVKSQVAQVNLELGPEPENATPEELAIRNAQAIHRLGLRLEDLEDTSALAYRYALWLVFRDDLWRIITISVTDETGNLVVNEDTGEIAQQGFGSYKEWFDFMTQRKSPSVKSMLWNGITMFFRAVDAGRGGTIQSGERKGEEWSVEDVAGITDRNLVVMASVSKKLDEKGESGQVATYMQTAVTGTQDELRSLAEKNGLTHRRVAQVEAYRAFLANGDQVTVIRSDEKQSRAVDVWLGNSVAWRSVTTEELGEMVDEFLDRGEVGDDDINEFLSSK